jgi:lipopolysaccharide assembly outer membrane protein LptD (OstA)
MTGALLMKTVNVGQSSDITNLDYYASDNQDLALSLEEYRNTTKNIKKAQKQIPLSPNRSASGKSDDTIG